MSTERPTYLKTLLLRIAPLARKLRQSYIKRFSPKTKVPKKKNSIYKPSAWRHSLSPTRSFSQSSLAGKAEMESVHSLGQLLHSVNYTDVVADWNTILKVNYRPIFKDARDLVEAFATDDRLVKPILTLLCEAARDLVDTGIAQIHELSGMVFQKLITDRKYVKANYTLPESAVLLSTLVMPELPEDKFPKVADFACGTGALLNGVYQRILSLYEQQGGSGEGYP